MHKRARQRSRVRKHMLPCTLTSVTTPAQVLTCTHAHMQAEEAAAAAAAAAEERSAAQQRGLVAQLEAQILEAATARAAEAAAAERVRKVQMLS